MNHIKVCDKIYLVGRGIWGGLQPLSAKFDCNIYLVDGGTEMALVDNGESFNLFKLKQNISSAGLDFRKIKKLIITHDHFDHTANTWILKKLLKAAVYAGKGSFFLLKPDKYLKNGDTLKVGGLSFKIYSVPGHTPDGICLESKIDGKKVLFSGDTAIGDQPGTGRGIVGWYNALWGSDLKKFIESVRFMKKLEPDLLLPGHGLPLLTKKKCRTSLVNCLKRLKDFGNFRELGSMMPLIYDKRGMEKIFNLGPGKQLHLKIKIRREKKP
ncbi:MAG: MBL fold metallo-hydrolase [Candidatus Firestonebacteria bacterium]